MASSIPTDMGNIPQIQLNGMAREDEKKGARVYQFDPDAPPEAKAASAAKGIEQLKSVTAKPDAGVKAVPIDVGGAPPIPPTITIEDADKDVTAKPDPPPAAPSPVESIPGALPDNPAYVIPDWYKVGWRAMTGIDDPPLSEGDEKDKSILAQHINEMYYGDWYHNAAIIFVAVVVTHFMTLFRLGWGWLVVVLAFCATYYKTSMDRVRRRARDDIQRELVKTRLATEHESAEWLNNFLDRFWLIYEPVLSKTIIASVDQILSASTPAFLDSIRLTHFTLGTKAPRVDKVRTFPTTERDIVMMDWSFSFTPHDDSMTKLPGDKTNPKIILTIRIGRGLATAPIPILLENMTFSGNMRIKMKLMTNFPHVQVVYVSFLEEPVIDYVLKPIGGETFGFDIANIPGLSSFIRDMVHSNLRPMMYDPNAFTLNLEQMLSGAPIDTAIGVVQININSARGLKAAKIGGGNPDPYISLNINGRAELARTQYRTSTVNPHWNETKYILVNNLTESLVLNVLDYNEHRKDTELGAATFDLSKLLEDASIEDIEQPVLKDGKEKGELRYDVLYYPVLTPKKIENGQLEPLPETKVGIVRLTIHQAKDLDSSHSMSGDLNPFAKVYTGSAKEPIHTTRKFKHTSNPVWESAHEFLCADRSESTITIKVIDDRDFLKDPMIGYLCVKLDDLLEAKKEGQGRDWWPLSGCKTGKVRISAEWKPLEMAGSLQGAADYSPPIGIVRLHMQKAVDVKNVEAGLGGKSDPYVRAMINHVTVARTEVINNNLNPVWDQIVYVPVHSLKERLVLEVMDYQHMTKDRSLGSVELPISQLAKDGNSNPRFLHETVGKKEYQEPIKLDSGSQAFKGYLHFTAEFVPAVHLKGVKFDGERSQLLKSAAGEDIGGHVVPDDASSVSSSDEERERVPEGVTVRRPKQSTSANGNGGSVPTSPVKAESVKEQPGDDAVEISKADLLKSQSGIIIFDVISGQLAKKSRLEILLDDGYWPAFGSIKARSLHAKWDQVGEGFIKELDFGRVWLRLNENDENEKEDIVAEFKCDAKVFLENCLDNPFDFQLQNEEERNKSTVRISAKFVPVEITLEPRESINNQGLLRVELVDGKNIHGADRRGTSDPYVVFTLNDKSVFKSEIIKKTLEPVWNAKFETSIPSRVAADFWLELFDWDQIGKDTSLGMARIDLTDLEPFQATERTLPLTSTGKHGDKGEIRIRLMFTPEIIAKSRKNTSTFSTAGRAMTQVGAIPFGAGKAAGRTVKGIFKKDSKSSTLNGSDDVPVPPLPPLPAGQFSKPLAPESAAGHSNGSPIQDGFPVVHEPGTMKVTVVSAKDFVPADDDPVRPYVFLKLGDKEHKTKRTDKTLTPEWNESFSFNVGPETKSFSATIYEYRAIGRDKPLGEGEVEIWRHLQPGGPNPVTAADVSVALRDGHGLLQLRLEFERAHSRAPSRSVSSIDGRPSISSPSRFSLKKKQPEGE